MTTEFPYYYELSAFIGDKIDSIEKWDMVVYFCRQMDAKESVSSLMALTGKTEPAIGKAASEFVSSGILSVRHSNNGKPDQYLVAPASRPLLEKLRIGLDDRQYRFKLMMLALESIRSRNMSLQEEKA